MSNVTRDAMGFARDAMVLDAVQAATQKALPWEPGTYSRCWACRVRIPNETFRHPLTGLRRIRARILCDHHHKLASTRSATWRSRPPEPPGLVIESVREPTPGAFGKPKRKRLKRRRGRRR